MNHDSRLTLPSSIGVTKMHKPLRRFGAGTLAALGTAIALVASTASIMGVSAASPPPPSGATAGAVTKNSLLGSPVGTGAPTGPNAPRRAARLTRALAPSSGPIAALPTDLCGSDSGTQICQIWAKAGSQTVPGRPAPLPIWGFTVEKDEPVSLKNPVLIFDGSRPIVLRLHNMLPEAGNMSISVPEAPVAPSQIGVPGSTPDPGPANTIDLNLGILPPGTYIYEAGPTKNAATQINMGLAGVMVVRPPCWDDDDGCKDRATHSAYGFNTGSEFSAEAVVAITEMDPDFNEDPLHADTRDFSPKYFFINGQAFDQANAEKLKINVAAGDQLLLRLANLGTRDHSLTLSGHRQLIRAMDSRRLAVSKDVASPWLTSGEVADAFISIDPKAVKGSHFALFDNGGHLNNANLLGLRGMFTYVDVVSSRSASTNPGPSTTAVNVAITNNLPGASLKTFTGDPAAHPGEQVQLTATFSAGATAAEWFLDAPGVPGTGKPFPVSGSLNISQAAMLTALTASPLPIDGTHTMWVHAKDGAGNWGAAAGAAFDVDTQGPVVDPSSLSVHMPVTNGVTTTADISPGCDQTQAPAGNPGQRITCNLQPNPGDLVVIGSATASLADWNVLGAEYCVDDPTCATATKLQLFTNPPPIAPKKGPYELNPFNGPDMVLPGGYVNQAMQDQLCTPVIPVGSAPPAVLPGAPGGAQTVSICGVIPAATIQSLPEGTHLITIRAFEGPNDTVLTGTYTADPSRNGQFVPNGTANPGYYSSPITVGRWGKWTTTGASISFVKISTGPTVSNTSVGPNPNNGFQADGGNVGLVDSVRVNATFTSASKAGGVSSNIAMGELFLGARPAPADYGKGSEMVGINGWNLRNPQDAYGYVPLVDIRAEASKCAAPNTPVTGGCLVQIWVHGKDAAGNWGDPVAVVLMVSTVLPVINTVKLNVAVPPATVETATITASLPAGSAPTVKIVAAEWFLGATDPGVGHANAYAIPAAAQGQKVQITFPIAAVPKGSQISFRVKDNAGNWSGAALVVGG